MLFELYQIYVPIDFCPYFHESSLDEDKFSCNLDVILWLHNMGTDNSYIEKFQVEPREWYDWQLISWESIDQLVNTWKRQRLEDIHSGYDYSGSNCILRPWLSCAWQLGPILLTWINLDPSMDK